MLSDLATLNHWWEGLSRGWKEIFISHLDLGDMFSLADIEYIQTIESLDCSGSSIESLSPIKMLPRLTHLDIGNNHIRDLSPLSSVLGLRELHATFCWLDRVEAIVHLPHLEVLDLSYPLGEIVDIERIGEISSLKQLYLNGCNVSYIMPFIDLPELEILSMIFNPIPKEGANKLRQTYSNAKVLV